MVFHYCLEMYHAVICNILQWAPSLDPCNTGVFYMHIYTRSIAQMTSLTRGDPVRRARAAATCRSSRPSAPPAACTTSATRSWAAGRASSSWWTATCAATSRSTRCSPSTAPSPVPARTSPYSPRRCDAMAAEMAAEMGCSCRRLELWQF